MTHNFSERASLNVDVDLIEFKIRNPSQYFVNQIDTAGYAVPQYQLRISKKTPIRVGVAKADYTFHFNEKLTVEAGAKLTVLHFENDVRVDSLPFQGEWTLMPDYTSLFVLNENVAGAYTSFTTQLSNKTDIKGGIRYEHTNTNLGSVEMPNVVDRHYGSWFPSLFIGHKFTETQNLHFSYSRRITRPQIKWLAPWLIFSDPTTLQGGNPAVQPSFTNSLSVDYGIKSLHFSVAYSRQDAPVAFVPLVDAKTNRQVNRPQNLTNAKIWSANLSFPLHPSKWWDIQSNFYLNHTETNLKIDGSNIQLSNANYGFNIVNSFKLPANFALEISGNYNSPGYWGVAKWRATGAANIGIQKDFGEKWGKLRLNASDLFLSTNWFGTTNQPQINLRVNESFQFAERVIMLSWTNTFGNRKLKSSRQRQTGSTEEAQRIKG
jgi:outer membrane receptor protein involved in Fe transport